MTDVWRRCSTCKEDILLGEAYFACSVSTCNRKGKESVFCSLPCWDAHVPVMNHKEAWSSEKKAPTVLVQIDSPREDNWLMKKIVEPMAAPQGETTKREILIVVSKLKDYIQQSAGMNTAGSVPDVLSDIVRRACDEAIEHARADGRKTVMDRDFKGTI